MRSFRSGVVVGALALLALGSATACRRAIVIVPAPSGGYTARDTLYGQMDGKNVRVTFRFDTLWRVDTVLQVDTLWRGGTRYIVRRDTIRIASKDTVFIVDTVVRRGLAGRVDPVRVPAPTTVVRVDTVRIVVTDTLIRRQTVTRTDTVRVAGQRMLFVPPGQYPPDGECRIWIHDLPPGRQARAAPCNVLGPVPAGAFILFAGAAWDFDFDWVAEARRGRVPPEIVALKRGGGGRP
jgi:hypothetical protein